MAWLSMQYVLWSFNALFCFIEKDGGKFYPHPSRLIQVWVSSFRIWMSKSPSKVSSDFTRASHQRKCQSGTSASVVQVTGESYCASTDGMLTYSQPPFSLNYPFKGNLLLCGLQCRLWVHLQFLPCCSISKTNLTAAMLGEVVGNLWQGLDQDHGVRDADVQFLSATDPADPASPHSDGSVPQRWMNPSWHPSGFEASCLFPHYLQAVRWWRACRVWPE